MLSVWHNARSVKKKQRLEDVLAHSLVQANFAILSELYLCEVVKAAERHFSLLLLVQCIARESVIWQMAPHAAISIKRAAM